MKKKILFVVLCAATLLFMAASRPREGSELTTANFPFAQAATWAPAGDEPTALAVGERTYATITTAIAKDVSGDGKIVLYRLPYGTNAIRIRVIGNNNDKPVVFDMLSGVFDWEEKDSILVLRGTLTFTTGTQAVPFSIFPSDTYTLADTVTLTASSDTASTKAWKIANPGAGSETCAEVMIDLQGDDILALVPTTIDTGAFVVLIKPY